jgi:hypothetical protein
MNIEAKKAALRMLAHGVYIVAAGQERTPSLASPLALHDTPWQYGG